MFDLLFKKERKIQWVLLIPVLGLLLFYLGWEAQDRDDFFIFYSGAQDLWTGQNIYHLIYNTYYHYLYSVFFAILLTPLTYLPFVVAKFIWLVFNLAALWRIFSILVQIALSGLTKRTRILVLLTSCLLALRFIHDNIHYGQISMILIWMGLESVFLIYQNKNWKGSLLLALACNIKILPIVLIPYLFYRRKFKAASLTLVFIVVLFILPALFIGMKRNGELIGSWWELLNPTNTEHVLDTYERSFHGLSTFFSVYLSAVPNDGYGIEAPREIANLDVSQLNWILNISRLLLILTTVYFLRWPPFRRSENFSEELLPLSYIFLIIPLIFPHQHHYSFLFALPALILVSKQTLDTTHVQPSKVLLLTLLLLLFNLQLFLGVFAEWYMHYKIVTWGGLFLVYLLFRMVWLSKKVPSDTLTR